MTSIAIAPMPMTVLRRPIDRLEPTTVWTSVVSVVRRDSTSPVCVDLEELRALADDVGIDRVAQVGGDALAEPAHHVEARGREDAERDADREQGEEMLAQRHHPRGRIGGDEALVDQRLERDRKDQRADRGQHEEQPREGNPAAVRSKEREQPGEGPDVARGGWRGGAQGSGSGRGSGRHGRQCRAMRASAIKAPAMTAAAIGALTIIV